MDISGMESGAQENAGGMPAGPEPYNPAGQMMPVDGGPGSSPTPGPGNVTAEGAEPFVSPGNPADSFVGVPRPGSDSFAPMPTPDN